MGSHPSSAQLRIPNFCDFLIVLNPPGINTHPKEHPSGARIPADHVLSDQFPVEFNPSAAICFSETETVMFLMFLLNSYNDWMEEILHQLIDGLSHYIWGFNHPRWCRIYQDFFHPLYHILSHGWATHILTAPTGSPWLLLIAG